ncbi:MAG: hypothetical protein ACI828_000809 [Flavobacteriales bacterium]|jgi:hypothetical protein
MFLGGLKEKSIVRKIRKDVEKRRFTLSRKRIFTMAILQDAAAPFNNSQLTALASELGIDVENITLLTYAPTLTKAQKEEELLVTDKQIGWKGVLKSEHLKKFAQKEFDVLVSYYNTDLLALQALVARSQAQVKVSISADALGLYDLVIHMKTGDEVVFVKELKKYLRILKIIE